MATTRVFRAGNSQAVRIPKAMAFANDIGDVEIERKGDTLTIRPVKPSMAELLETVRAASVGLPRRERLPIDYPKRDWDRDIEDVD